MNSGVEYQLLVEAIRALFVIGLPIIVAASIAGTVVAALQSATTLFDPALSYSIRLLAVSAIVYFMFSNFARLVMDLMVLALSGGA